MLPVTRQTIEQQIAALIDLLDTLDPDPDLEPSLGWSQPAGHPLETPSALLRNANAGDDREEDDEREPDEDGEPSLGWTESGHLGHPYSWDSDRELATGPIRKTRPNSKTGKRIMVGAEVFK